MNAVILKNAGIDYDGGVKRFAGRAHLYEKALSKFLSDTTFSRIRAAYALNDRAQLLADAHECKGMCGNIALTKLSGASDAMVRLLRGGAYTDADVADAYARLETEYRIALEAVRAATEAVE